MPWSIWLLLLFYAPGRLRNGGRCGWMTGLRAVLRRRAAFTVLLPVSAALVGVLVLGERFTPLQLLAAFGLALASVVLATCPRGWRARGMAQRGGSRMTDCFCPSQHQETP